LRFGAFAYQFPGLSGRDCYNDLSVHSIPPNEHLALLEYKLTYEHLVVMYLNQWANIINHA
jgi:hypothetical protein